MSGTATLSTADTNPINRRQHERFTVSPMYCPVSLRPITEDRFSYEGHAYDVSEGGVMFEMDQGFEPGTGVALQITLPGDHPHELDSDRSIYVMGNVIWMDDSEPGPVRMAIAFTRFARFGDRERLLRGLSRGTLMRRAA
ncbi:MAG: PilZ domain-containing protein [Phycisphaerales bacterium]|nr:PilZ domain-containing protein [Phycisphaerales bacterium]